MEEQFPRLDIPDLYHVRHPVSNMHRNMDNLLPRIAVHNMRLQVALSRTTRRENVERLVSRVVAPFYFIVRQHVTTDFVLSSETDCRRSSIVVRTSPEGLSDRASAPTRASNAFPI